MGTATVKEVQIFMTVHSARAMHGRMLVLHISHNARVYSGTNAMHYDNIYCMTMK
jgi:hypothetical protein